MAGSYTLPTFTYESWNGAADLFSPGDGVALVGAGSANYTLNATAGHSGIQGLIGGLGNDTLNGTDGSEVLNGGGGVNILNAGGGNDRLAAVNGTPFGGSATTFTFAGSVFDGGDGTDYLSIGGYVNFQGSLEDIEGIDLQAAVAPTEGGPAGQEAATLEIASDIAIPCRRCSSPKRTGSGGGNRCLQLPPAARAYDGNP